MNQIELEHSMYYAGRARAERMMQGNEERGRANSNPYAQAVFRRFVLPLAQLVRDDLSKKAAGRRQAHVVLLESIPADAVAFIATRAVLNHVFSGAGNDSQSPGRMLMHEIGRSVYHEYLLRFFEEASPELFHALVNDFERRASKNERHRLTVFKMQAKANGIEIVDWGIGGKSQVGAYLVEKLSQLGMVDINRSTHRKGRKMVEKIDVTLTEGALELVSSIKEFIAESTPVYMPCIEEPLPWVSVTEGGYHTKEMRRQSPWAVRCKPQQVDQFKAADMTKVLAALNALQAVKWRINAPMLDIIYDCSRRFDMDEILLQGDLPRPDKPGWLDEDMKKEDMDERQLGQFVQWKHAQAEWHTEKKLRGTRFNRFYSATRVAEKFRDQEALHFVYFADFRGRFYTQTTGINPQGSDLQRALLEFSEGKAMTTEAAVRWFKITGANRFGFDKATLNDRVKWVDTRDEMLIRFGTDPIAHNEWREADKPLQFLAWCMEYAAWRGDPSFESRIAVGMDGSCNGLQNFSAMLRDQFGGVATNLVPGALPRDIYQMVADVTTRILRLDSPDDEYRNIWLEHGINRTLVKRSVMTLPYGSTRYSCSDFIVEDYLRKGLAPCFTKDQYRKAAQYLSYRVWAAIAEVVVKAREAMDWLQTAAKSLIGMGLTDISWVTPSGFPVSQVYWVADEHRINTRLCGNTKIVVCSESSTPCRRTHSNGIAPNFIHSMDASHLHLTVLAATAAGIDGLAMVHDDYGCHAADADQLFLLIREVFVRMYEEHDPLRELADRYPMLREPPPPGDLDIRQVLQSTYFFS